MTWSYHITNDADSKKNSSRPVSVGQVLSGPSFPLLSLFRKCATRASRTARGARASGPGSLAPPARRRLRRRVHASVVMGGEAKPLPPPRSQYHAERIRDVFTQLDVNGKGILSFDEIRLGLEREGFDWVRLASESFPSAMTLRAIRPRATSPSSASRRVGASLVAVPLPSPCPFWMRRPVPRRRRLTAPPRPPQKKLRSRSRTSTGRR